MDDEKLFKLRLNRYKKLIDNKLLEIKKIKSPSSLYKPINYFLDSQGKRLRPTLVLAVAEALGESPIKVINQAAAVELLHNFTLIHDDIMDNSDLRHGKKTVHTKYDISTAILAGDNLLALAFKYLTKNLKINYSKIVEAFTNEVVAVCEGQSLDKEFETKKRVSFYDYFEMIEKKTASMTELSCKIGALSVGADLNLVKKFANFGKNLGLAFQIQDDLLDVISNTSKTGKKIGSDLVEGKKTVLLLIALKYAKDRDLNYLSKLIENKGINPNYINLYIDIYDRLGVIIEAKEMVRKHTASALKQLQSTALGGRLNFLDIYARHLLNRVS